MVVSSDKIAVEVEGEKLTAWFNDKDELVWDDGDVWQKQQETDVKPSTRRTLTMKKGE
ncbi:Zcchc6 [Symbiodinium sp. CCMP2456]|nr:Zcchc6 [Symbiodinium sp. CCMP2456]